MIEEENCVFEPEKLKYDERGLIPAIVQDAESGTVLMLAYMNLDSLQIGRAHV